MELKKRLKHKIESNGLSVSRLAKRTGVPNTTIANWLAGQSPKNIQQLKKVANHFDITIDELVFGEAPTRKVSDFDFEQMIYAGQFDVILKPIKGKLGGE